LGFNKQTLSNFKAGSSVNVDGKYNRFIISNTSVNIQLTN